MSNQHHAVPFAGLVTDSVRRKKRVFDGRQKKRKNETMGHNARPDGKFIAPHHSESLGSRPEKNESRPPTWCSSYSTI
jgi:hypothetical protein